MAESDGSARVALFTKQISLSNIVEEGFEELVANRDQHVKILVQPSE